jgi:glycosyltransferase involved in cell wall biosynthesis
VRVALIDWVCEPDRPGTTGLSDVVWDTADALAGVGVEPVVVGAYDRGARVPRPSFPLLRLDRPRAWQRNIAGHLLTCLALARGLGRVRAPDVVFAAEYLSAPLVALLRRDLPVAFTTPGNIFERIHRRSNPFDPATTQVYKIAALVAARRCAHVIAISRDMRDWWLRTGAPSERITVVPHGVDTRLFQPRPDARAQLGIPAEQEAVVYAGRLSPEKNVAVLVQALAGLAPRRPRLKLHILGRGVSEPGLRALVGQLGLEQVVAFRGWVDRAQLPAYYAAADLFALPSTSEPLGRVLLEAMACGTPVAASALGGPLDVVDPGRTGLLIAPHDIAGWRSAIERVLDDGAWRRSLGQAARAKVEREYAWPVVARRLRDEVFEPVARRTRIGRRGEG